MRPDDYPERRPCQLRLAIWSVTPAHSLRPVARGLACASLAGLAVACRPAGSAGTADAPTSVTPATPDAPVPGDLAATGEFIGPDDAPAVDMASMGLAGLRAKQVTCPGGGTTSVSGTVYIPSGELTLYNAMVYVPNGNSSPFKQGASCGCEISGDPIASALTDANGHFVLENVPVGSDIPLVVQVGEWRREFNIGTVEACVDTPVADQTLRLPSRQSEGDMPKIAVATGALDALECLVRKLGIAPEEFTNPSSSGRVNLFAGFGGADHYVASMNGGEAFPPSVALWSDLPSLQAYDIALLSCDGRRPDKTGADDKDPRSMQAMFDYLNLGGRVFASHYQEVWFQKGPAPFPDLAQYAAMPRELGSLSAQVVTSFPKGQAMSDWALANGASTTPGQVDIRGAQYTIAQENPAYAQRWLSDDNPPAVQYLSANTPLGAADRDQCGRVVLSDLHVSPGLLNEGDDVSTSKVAFPDGCVSKGFSPQEKLLAFMLFDISACVVPDSQAPSAPQIR